MTTQSNEWMTQARERLIERQRARAAARAAAGEPLGVLRRFPVTETPEAAADAAVTPPAPAGEEQREAPRLVDGPACEEEEGGPEEAEDSFWEGYEQADALLQCGRLGGDELEFELERTVWDWRPDDWPRR